MAIMMDLEKHERLAVGLVIYEEGVIFTLLKGHSRLISEDLGMVFFFSQSVVSISIPFVVIHSTGSSSLGIQHTGHVPETHRRRVSGLIVPPQLSRVASDN